jgi:aminoglycoside phosphotransferase (APT) family kinase protein
MATPNVPPSPSPPPSAAEAVETTSIVGRFIAFLRSQGDQSEVSDARPLGGGRSAQMLAMRLTDGAGSHRDVVLAREAADGPVSGMSDVRRQFDVLKALEDTPVKAPRPLWVCEDPGPLGAPFLVTELMPGRVADPWRPDGREFLRRHRDEEQFRDAIVGALVDIHAVAGGSLPESARRARSVSAGRREVGRWLQRIERSTRFRDDPVLAYAAAWLDRHEPEQNDWTLFHGDFRVGNLLVDGSSVTAVLDWEFAEEGDPVFDLALLCSLPMMVDGRLDGIWYADDLIARYQAMSGRRVSAEQMRYYLVLSAFKIAGVWVNGSVQFSDGVDDLHSLRAGFSAVDLLLMVAAALDLPVPPNELPTTADPTRRALALLRRSLRDEVMPALADGPARERAAVILAALRSLAQSPDRTPAQQRWEQDVLDFLADLRAQSTDFKDDVNASLRARLTYAIRTGFGPSGPELENGPFGARLRDLVGRAARYTSEVWL